MGRFQPNIRVLLHAPNAEWLVRAASPEARFWLHLHITWESYCTNRSWNFALDFESQNFRICPYQSSSGCSPAVGRFLNNGIRWWFAGIVAKRVARTEEVVGLGDQAYSSLLDTISSQRETVSTLPLCNSQSRVKIGDINRVYGGCIPDLHLAVILKVAHSWYLNSSTGVFCWVNTAKKTLQFFSSEVLFLYIRCD